MSLRGWRVGIRALGAYRGMIKAFVVFFVTIIHCFLLSDLKR